MNLSNAFLLTLVSCVIVACATTWPSDLDWNAPAPNNENILAFVGEKVFVRFDSSFPSEERVSSDKAKNNSSKNEDDEIVVSSYNPRFISRFLLKEKIIGTPLKENVDFAIHRHVGVPEFENYHYALIVLEKDLTEGWQAPDDSVFEVYPTANGQYALCGNVSDDYIELENLTVPLEDIPFSPPVIIDWRSKLSQSPSDESYNQYLRDFYSEPWFEEKGEKAKCLKGIYAKKLVELLLSDGK
ncbi:hypothetical protein N9W89_01285 [Hellea sp.]|nr:hypothetical protein [Hellea sp.]